MKILFVSAISCILATASLASEGGVAYKCSNGIALTVFPPADGKMRVESATGERSRGTVRINAPKGDFDPGSLPTAKEALDSTCQRILNAIERRKVGEKNRPRLEKELNELYVELAADAAE